MCCARGRRPIRWSKRFSRATTGCGATSTRSACSTPTPAGWRSTSSSRPPVAVPRQRDLEPLVLQAADGAGRRSEDPPPAEELLLRAERRLDRAPGPEQVVDRGGRNEARLETHPLDARAHERPEVEAPARARGDRLAAVVRDAARPLGDVRVVLVGRRG